MSGAGVRIDHKIDDQNVLVALSALLTAAGSLKDPFEDFGQYLLLADRERFDREESPDGSPWEPLKPEYKKRKKKNADKILVLDSYLRDSREYNADDYTFEFGSNSIYAATQHFGDDERGIPARPNIGLSDDDELELLDILTAHLTS